MKKYAVLLALFLSFSVVSVQAQEGIKVRKYETFDFYKGIVSIEKNHYDSFYFLIKNKTDKKVAVRQVAVDDKVVKFRCTSILGYDLYEVRIPRNIKIVAGNVFSVRIELNTELGGFLMGAYQAKDDGGSDPNDGGPGGGGDPTVIIIKYP